MFGKCWGPAGEAAVNKKCGFDGREMAYLSSSCRMAERRATKSDPSCGVCGYSQSTSRPSKGRSFSKATAVCANFSLPAGDEAGVAKLELYDQPPIDSRTLRFLLRFLWRYSCFRQPYRF